MTRSFSILAALALLAGCSAATQQRFNIGVACHREAGPQPYPAAGLFGLAGALAVQNTPEMQAYFATVDACVARKLAAADLAH